MRKLAQELMARWEKAAEWSRSIELANPELSDASREYFRQFFGRKHRDVKSSPLFIINPDDTHSIRSWDNSLIFDDTGAFLLPFPTLRLLYGNNLICVYKFTEGITVEYVLPDDTAIFQACGIFDEKGINWKVNTLPISEKAKEMAGQKNRPVAPLGALTEVMDHIRSKLSQLCQLCNHPANRIAICKPRSGRSAEWIKKNEHYVVLRPGNISKTKDDQIKVNVEWLHAIGQARQIGAHSRRAHFALLTAPRFKAKRNQKVWRRAAWIGPREWADEQQNVVYQIIDDHLKKPGTGTAYIPGTIQPPIFTAPLKEPKLIPTRAPVAYADKLRDPRWLAKRQEIIERDSRRCSLCANSAGILHVHHKRYEAQYANPWEYPNDLLITLCGDCHAKFHGKK